MDVIPYTNALTLTKKANEVCAALCMFKMFRQDSKPQNMKVEVKMFGLIVCKILDIFEIDS